MYVAIITCILEKNNFSIIDYNMNMVKGELLHRPIALRYEIGNMIYLMEVQCIHNYLD